MDYLLRVVPDDVFDVKLYEDTEKLKVRNIPVDKKIKIFSGFLEKQKIFL